jgi:hypothetical protein
MVILLLSPTILSLLIFGAHLFRNGAIPLVLAVLLSLPLLLVERGWVARFFQALLLVVALEWARSAFVLALERDEAGQPWLRAVLILAAVALFALFAGVLFETRTLLRAYPRSYDD